MGNHVATLQDSLNKCYRKGLSVDRDYGAKTRDALKAAPAVASPSETRPVRGPDC